MKQTLFTLLVISVIGLASCRKNTVDPDIKQVDNTEITNYIKTNGLTDMIRDTVGGDTTGIYYKLILNGSGPAMQYSDKISFVFSLRSFDGKYISTDTIENHYDNYLGHVSAFKLPEGLQLALHNILKHRGASMRLLLPSHLAYGLAGYGSGSSQNGNSHINGNQCLDYYVHVIGGDPAVKSQAAYQADYDDLVIRNYMTTNSLTGYTKTASGLYYKVTTPGTGAAGAITNQSTVYGTYKGTLLNETIFDQSYATTPLYFELDNGIEGVREALVDHATTGTTISMIMPSKLGYGQSGQSSIGADFCLRFEWTITSVTP